MSKVKYNIHHHTLILNNTHIKARKPVGLERIRTSAHKNNITNAEVNSAIAVISGSAY